MTTPVSRDSHFYMVRTNPSIVGLQPDVVRQNIEKKAKDGNYNAVVIEMPYENRHGRTDLVVYTHEKADLLEQHNAAAQEVGPRIMQVLFPIMRPWANRLKKRHKKLTLDLYRRIKLVAEKIDTDKTGFDWQSRKNAINGFASFVRNNPINRIVQ